MTAASRRHKQAAPPKCSHCGEPERLYTAEEARAFLGGIAASWLEKGASNGRIPATYIGRYLRFSTSNIREIQQMHERRPVSEHRSLRSA